MILGQGSPTASPTRRLAGAAWIALRLAVVLWLLANIRASAAADSLRIRVEWGGGAARQWEGRISIAQGAVADPVALGIEADEPGSMWIKDGVMIVRQPASRTYDGVDLTVTGALDQQLQLQFVPVDAAAAAKDVCFKLSELACDIQSSVLDNQGNRVLVRRAPGDKLQVRLERSSLVFRPGEVLKMEVRPNALCGAAGSRVRLAAQLLDARGSATLWSKEDLIRLGEPTTIRLEIPLPSQEGVYEVAINATPSGWQQAVRAPLGVKPLAERKVQLLVLDTRSPPPKSAADLRTVVEIDPVNPHWSERFSKLPQLPALARLRHGPLGNGNFQVRPHPLGNLAQLNPNQPPDLSWEAYSLPINRPGMPHVVEVDYPSNTPETMGISVVEPNAAGAIAPVGLDSGFDQPASIVSDDTPPHWNHHRLVFWPRTRTPMLLITNRSDRQPALYGKIRVLSGWEQLPPAAALAAPPAGRLLAAYMDRPLLTENFSANQALDGWSGRSLQDWSTFYEGGTRLVEHLRHVGYDGLMLSVLADGSTIYPSGLLEPTPRYDTGVLFDTGQDPLRKDVLEMLLRLFDRDRLWIIPTLDFAAPLPRLEEIRRRGGAEAEGLEWIGPDGVAWCQSRLTRRGLGPYYNVLDLRVQAAMLDVVRELLAAYAQHPSFTALAIQLSADGYAELPGPEWGMDDATIARFQQDTRLQVPGTGASRFSERAQFLATEPHRRMWLQWRADELHKFYRRVHAELAVLRPGSRLYLTGANMFSRPDLENELRPTLPRRTTMADMLLLVGIDVRQFQDDQGLVLLHCSQIAPSGRLNGQALGLEMERLPDVDRCFHDLGVKGSLFYHVPQPVHLSSFDAASPFHPTYAQLMPQLVPSGAHNRQRFVHALATLDPQQIFDGGALLPLGQEDSLRGLFDTYCRLPPVHCERLVEATGSDSSQPVTIRTCNYQGRTYAYLVNDAPLAVSIRVRVDAPADCRMEELTGARPIPQRQRDGQQDFWTVDLKPYDLLAVSLSAPDVRFSQPVVRPAQDVEGDLTLRIRELGVRAALLRNAPPLGMLRNPGFEFAAADDGQISGWTICKQPGATIQLDSKTSHGGAQSLRLASNGPCARVVSEPFASPATGRLTLRIWLRVADPNRQPPLRLALEGPMEGGQYFRFAMLGAAPAKPITAEWAEYLCNFDDLPLEGLGPLRIWLELSGPGEVWIDDAQLFNLYFTNNERVELSKLIALADVKLQNGQISDCIYLLQGYWPRFLEAHVPLNPGSLDGERLAGRGARRGGGDSQDSKPDRSGLLDRLKGILPPWKR